MSEKSEFKETHTDVLFEWKLKEFSSLPKEVGYSMISATFLLADAKWILVIYPYGNREDRTGWISLYLQRKCSLSLQNYVSFTMGVKKCDGSVYISKDENYKFVKNGVGFGYHGLVQTSELLDSNDILDPDGTLTVFLTARVAAAWQQDISVVETSCQTSSMESQEPFRSSIEILQTNFNDLFLSGRHADVTINVQDQVFKVHRSILTTRSPVFACMFNHDTEEKKTGIVNIADFYPAFFGDFLSFMYSGKLNIISQINAVDLYKAADKYDVKDLKSECVQYMEKELSSEIFCDVIDLASVYGESKLLKKATEFFVENVKTILPTSKWQCLLEERSTLANELLIKMVNMK